MWGALEHTMGVLAQIIDPDFLFFGATSTSSSSSGMIIDQFPFEHAVSSSARHGTSFLSGNRNYEHHLAKNSVGGSKHNKHLMGGDVRLNHNHFTCFARGKKAKGGTSKFAMMRNLIPVPSLKPAVGEREFYKLVNLYPQMHHPVFATQPVVMMSHNDWHTVQQTPANPEERSLDELKDAVQEAELSVEEQKKIKEQEVGTVQMNDELASKELNQMKTYDAFKPFGDPKHPANTRILFPTPVDW